MEEGQGTKYRTIIVAAYSFRLLLEVALSGLTHSQIDYRSIQPIKENEHDESNWKIVNS